MGESRKQRSQEYAKTVDSIILTGFAKDIIECQNFESLIKRGVIVSGYYGYNKLEGVTLPASVVAGHNMTGSEN